MWPHLPSRRLGIFGLVTAATCLAACTTIVSRTPGETAFATRSSSKLGLHYSLPKARVRIVGAYRAIEKPESPDSKKMVVDHQIYEVTVSKTNLADPKGHVFSEITTNGIFTEDTHLKVTKGLLETAHSKPEDQTGAVLVSLANTAINVAKVMANLGGAADPGEGSAPKDVRKKVTPFDVEFDPYNVKQVQRARNSIARSGFTFEGEGTQHLEYHEGAEAPEPPNASVPGVVRNGLLYRAPQALVFTLTKLDDYDYDFGAGDFTEPAFSQSITVPNLDGAGIASMPMRRVFMAKRETTVAFVEGEPMEITMTQGSPVLNFVKIPEQISAAAAAAIPEIIRIRQETPKKGLEAQNAILEQQIKLMENQKKLQDLQEAQKAAQDD